MHAVLLQVPGEQHVVTATVIRDNADDGTWPPVFTVRLPDTHTVDVTHAHFTAVGLPPGARGGAGGRAPAHPIAQPPDALPSVAPSLPGAHAQTRATPALDRANTGHAASGQARAGQCTEHALVSQGLDGA